MADGRIQYRIEVATRELDRARREAVRFRRAVRGEFAAADNSARRHQAQVAKTSAVYSTLRSSIGGLVAAYAGLRGAQAFVALSDEAINLRNQIKAATRETGEFAEVTEELNEISRETFTPLQTSVKLYREIARLRPELQSTLEQETDFVRAINQAAQISGASATDISNSLRQLSQGLAGGVLRAEEFNSIIENTPEIAQRIAIGMGTTVGQLRRLVVDGKVLSSQVFAAILSQTEAINRDFERLEGTVGREAVNLRNAAVELAGVINDSFGVGSLAAGAISFFSGQLDRTAESIRIVARLLGRDTTGPAEPGAGSLEEAERGAPLPQTVKTELAEVMEVQLEFTEASRRMWGVYADGVEAENKRAAASAQITLGQVAQSHLGVINQFVGGIASIASQNRDASAEAFETWKRFATAQAAISTALGIVNIIPQSALYGGPIGVGIATGLVAALGAAQIAQIQSQQFTPRQFGGPVRAGQLYEVGEAGPELLRSGGRNFLLPGRDGDVVPNSEMGMPIININNFGADVEATQTAQGVDLTIRARREIAEGTQI